MHSEDLKNMGRADLIGPGKHHLIPAWQPQGTGDLAEGACRPHMLRNGRTVNENWAGANKAQKTTEFTTPMRTQHTGLKGVSIPKLGAKTPRNRKGLR